MSALQKIAYLSEQDYLAFELTADCRHEYVDGHIHAMAGASERHNRICGNIFYHLRTPARGTSCGVFASDMKLRIDSGRLYYYPDIMLICNPDDNEEYYKKQPCLIAEVLSSGTTTTDRREKWSAYQKIAGLRYYLLVSSDRERVEYFLRAGSGDWQTAVLDADEMIAVNCEHYQAVLRLADIYEDVVFE